MLSKDRLGYVYKKPKLVPGHPDIDAQEEFIKHYEELMMKKADDVEVLFMDAVHPEHNTMAAYGWMKRGERKELKTNSGRQRLNLHGVINAETHEVTLIESDTINKDSTLQLLELVEQRYFLSSMVYIIRNYSALSKTNTCCYAFRSSLKSKFLPSPACGRGEGEGFKWHIRRIFLLKLVLKFLLCHFFFLIPIIAYEKTSSNLK